MSVAPGRVALRLRRAAVDIANGTPRTPLSDRTPPASAPFSAGTEGVTPVGVTRRRAGRITPADGWSDEPDFLAGLEVLPRLLGADGPRRPLHRAEVERQEAEVLHWLRVADSPARARRLLAQKDGVPEVARREAEQILAGVTVGRPGQDSPAEREEEAVA